MDAQLQQELNEISKKFTKLIRSLDNKTLDDVLSYSAQPLIRALKSGAPKSNRTHYRYDTPKLVRRIRAPNGKGVRIASYTSGNLSRSMKKLTLRRMKKAVLIGPKVNRGKTKGTFSNDRRTDGYYAHFVEKGTRKQSGQGFIRLAAASSRNEVKRRLEQSFGRLLQKQINALGFGNR